MTSPLSVGDCIAIVGIAVKAYGALSGISDDTKEQSKLTEDLTHLEKVLELLPKQQSPALPSDRTVLSGEFNDAVRHCQEALTELAVVVGKYGPAASRVTRSYRRMAWTFSGKKKVEPLQRRIQRLTVNLMLIQNDHHRKAIESLGAALQEQTHDLFSQVQQVNEGLKLYTSIDDPSDQKAVNFQDATGEKYLVSLNLCQKFEDFLDFLMFIARKNSAVLPFVVRKDFWLFTPAVNGSPWWYLIHENDWAKVVRSGLRLGMSIFEECIEWKSKIMIFSCNETVYILRKEEKRLPFPKGPGADSYGWFSRPVPPWSTLPQDLEFRWWSEPARLGPVSMIEQADDGRRLNIMASFDSSENDLEQHAAG